MDQGFTSPFSQGWPWHDKTRALHAYQGAFYTLQMLQRSCGLADRDAGSSFFSHEAACSTMVKLNGLESAHEGFRDLTGGYSAPFTE